MPARRDKRVENMHKVETLAALMRGPISCLMKIYKIFRVMGG